MPKASSAAALARVTDAAAPPVEARMAGLIPYLDIQGSLGADDAFARHYGKFHWLDVMLGSLPPGQASVV